jgi:hypothetical protein
MSTGNTSLVGSGFSWTNTFNGPTSMRRLGQALAIGDLNADGTGDLVIGQQRHHAFEQALLVAPDARFVQRHGQRPAMGHGVVHLLERQDVRFFLARNPGYLRGNELVCVCELAVDNLKPLAARFFRRSAGAIR